MPLYRRLPHRGFNQYQFRTEFEVVNVGALVKLDAAITEVTPAVLAAAGLIRAGDAPVAVLGGGEISRALKITAARFSASAKTKIEKAGGQAVVG
jgi:large subunit ribosomal protein L15